MAAAASLGPPVASLMVSMVFRLGPSPPLPFSLVTSELGAPRRVLAAILVPSSDVSTYSSQLEQPWEEIYDVPGVDVIMLGLCPAGPSLLLNLYDVHHDLTQPRHLRFMRVSVARSRARRHRCTVMRSAFIA